MGPSPGWVTLKQSLPSLGPHVHIYIEDSGSCPASPSGIPQGQDTSGVSP